MSRIDQCLSDSNAGLDWLHNIPEHWHILSLRRVVKDFVDYRGQTPEKIDKGVPLITARNVKDGFLSFQDSQDFISSDLYENWMVRGLPEIGDVLVTTEAPLGNVAQIVDSNVALAQRLILLKTYSEIIYNDYLKYYFMSIGGKSELLSQATGSTAEGIKASKFKGILVCVPPLSQQRKIADYLDRETQKIDALIAAKKRLIELLAEKRRLTIVSVVAHGLDSNVVQWKSEIPWLDRIPSHWQVERARYLFAQASLPISEKDEIVTCFRDGQVTLRKNRREDGFTNAVLEIGYQGIRVGQLVLHSMDAFAGAIGISDSNGKCSPEYIICDPIVDDIFNPYYGYLLREMALQGFIQASCPAVRERAPRIRFSDFADMLLPVPPLIEQKQIVEYVIQKLRSINDLTKASTTAITLLQERRASLISAAVTGQLPIPD